MDRHLQRRDGRAGRGLGAEVLGAADRAAGDARRSLDEFRVTGRPEDRVLDSTASLQVCADCRKKAENQAIAPVTRRTAPRATLRLTGFRIAGTPLGRRQTAKYHADRNTSPSENNWKTSRACPLT